MDRISELRRVLMTTDTTTLANRQPVDDLLLHLIVHLAFADGEVDEAEFDRLGKLMPTLSYGELMEEVLRLQGQQLEVSRLEAEIASPTDRRRLLKLAEEFVALDGRVDVGEARLLDALRQEIG